MRIHCLRPLLAGAVTAALLIGPAAAAAKPKPTPCAGADVLPAEIGMARAATAAVCLINRERRGRGLPLLTRSRVLGAVALAHGRDMVTSGFLGHNSSTGQSFVDRVLSTGYAGGRPAGVVLGENLAWGSAATAAPGRIVRAWMASPAHRATILSPGFTQIGLAVVPGTPSGTAPLGATYTATFAGPAR